MGLMLAKACWRRPWSRVKRRCCLLCRTFRYRGIRRDSEPHASGLLPEITGDLDRIDTQLLPPDAFIAGAVMGPAQRNRILVAHGRPRAVA
jgi:hypothetical protein